MAARILTLLVIVLLLGLVTMPVTEAVDCRRYVFAPVCRGISAKRAHLPPLPFGEYRPSSDVAQSSSVSLSSSSSLPSKPNGSSSTDVRLSRDSDDVLRSLLWKYLNQLDAAAAAAAVAGDADDSVET